MKIIRTVLAIVLAVVLCAGALPVAAEGAVATIGQATARPGDTVTIPVTIDGLADIAGIDVHIEYDATRLECVSAKVTGFVAQMAMASANTKVASAPDQIWLTALSLSGVNGGGEALVLTFRVRDDAAQGLAKVAVVERSNQLSTSQGKDAPLSAVSGGVTVSNDAATQTTAVDTGTSAVVTLPPDVSTQAGEVPTTTYAIPEDDVTTAATSMTKPGGETIELPAPEPATDVNGNEMVDENGDLLYVQGVAVTIDSVEGAPGETVTVRVATSAVTDLTALVFQIGYDSEALEYIGGATEGYLKDAMAWAKVMADEQGVVSVGGTHPTGISGEGVIATLQFKVKTEADALDYRLSLKSSCEMQAGDVNVPLYLFSGEVRVMGENRNIVTPIVIVAVLVLAAIGITVLAMGVRRKKTEPAKTESTEE